MRFSEYVPFFIIPLFVDNFYQWCGYRTVKQRHKYEKETIKAQTVIARSNLYRKIKETDDLSEIFAMIRESAGEPGKIWVLPESVYEEAAEETRGQVLSFEGELKLVPYHEISGGMTSNGSEVFQDEE